MTCIGEKINHHRTLRWARTAGLAGDVVSAGFPIKLGRTHTGYTDPHPASDKTTPKSTAGLLGLSADRITELSDRQII